MNKSFIENSLKRFLKRKVKITLGLVVAFMITGAFAFAGEEQKEIETAKKYLAGLGTKINLDKEITAENVKISSDNGGIKITFAGNKEVAVSKDIISAETGKVIQNSLNLINDGELSAIENEEYNKGFNLKDNGTVTKNILKNEMQVSGAGNVYVNEGTLTMKQVAKDGAVIVNKGIIAHNTKRGQIIEESTGYNYGVIANNGSFGQSIGGKTEDGKIYGGTGYNYGIIANNGGIGQYIYDKGINYGIIASNGDYGQVVYQGGEAINYGVIANNGNLGQASLENNTNIPNKLINYGVIANTGNAGQRASSAGTIAINYGIIANKGAQGQYGDTLYNYGIIRNSGNSGQIVTNRGYNYGIIENQSTDNSEYNFSIETVGKNSKAENYGVVKSKTGRIFKKTSDNPCKIDNYGIVILTDDNHQKVWYYDANASGMGAGNNRGVVLTNNYELLEQKQYWTLEQQNQQEMKDINAHVIDLRKENNKISSNTDTEETYYTKDKTAEFDGNLTNKVLNAVITQEGTTAFKYTGENDLVLNNSQIVGFFTNAGTLLEVNQNLTLNGNSVINAVEDNMNVEGVTAVKLGDKKTLTLGENSKVLGKVEGNAGEIYINNHGEHLFGKDLDSITVKTTSDKDPKTTDIRFDNVKLTNKNNFENTSGKFIIDNQSSEKLEGKEVSTNIVLGNNIEIEKGIDGSSSAEGFELTLGDGQTSSDETIKIGGEILLGQADDTIIINNILGKYNDKTAVINGNNGNDTAVLKNSNGKHDTFDYNLKNIETLDLNAQSWIIGENAEISHENGGTTEIKNGTLTGELTSSKEYEFDFINSSVDEVIKNSNFIENSSLKLGIGEGMSLEAGAEYDIEDTSLEALKTMTDKEKITASGIFTKANDENKEIRVKTAEEMNIFGRYAELYEKMLENADKEEVLDILNNSSADDIAGMINGKGALGDTLSTTGYKITRDIINSFMSAVNEWDKKAGKGEWLANAKYINSDVEYDGANDVKGYDSDINSMVGMIEYGVSDNTSYGIALGGGDTEIDVKGAGTLEGENYYIGAYAKHSVNGFDLVGNLGYTISDLDVDDKGSADSSAVTVGGYVKRDISLTETVRIEPNFAFTYDYIMQDDAEGEGVKTDGKDIHVFEAAAGMNIVKGFNFEKGLLEIKAGAKYSMADTNLNEEPTVISLYDMENIELGNPDIDKTRGTAHVGFSYEHENGFGINGKYEMMWSDSGDDERVTAGISYRF